MDNTILEGKAYSELHVRLISFLLSPAQELALLVGSTTIRPTDTQAAHEKPWRLRC